MKKFEKLSRVEMKTVLGGVVDNPPETCSGQHFYAGAQGCGYADCFPLYDECYCTITVTASQPCGNA